MKDIWEYLQKQQRPIVLYGIGNGADKVIRTLVCYGLRPSGVFAGTGHTKKKLFHGMPVTDFFEAKAAFPDMIVLVCFGTALPIVMNEIIGVAKQCELYIPDVPVYGNTLFNKKFYVKNQEHFNALREQLADNLSRETLDSCLRYKLGGQLRDLRQNTVSTDELYGMIPFIQDSICIDAGAYIGDTVALIRQFCPAYKEIIAVEPDAKSFGKLTANTKNFHGMTCVNACIGEKSGTVPFFAAGGRNSCLNGTGKMTVQTSVDELLCDRPAHFIKADIEGGELRFLDGAENAIKNYHPILLLACYHRSEDLFVLPEKVLSFYPGYRIFLRRNLCFPCWDLNFLFLPEQ